MGCDIHMIVERKKNGNKWEAFMPQYLKKWDDTLCVSRNYELFEHLAGVRGYSENAIVQPRGIPKNASQRYKSLVKNWGEDGHTHSYLTLEELLKFSYGDNYLIGKHNRMSSISPEFSSIIKSITKFELAVPGVLPSDIRFMFFFDN
jgi:hypothetical protein